VLRGGAGTDMSAFMGTNGPESSGYGYGGDYYFYTDQYFNDPYATAHLSGIYFFTDQFGSIFSSVVRTLSGSYGVLTKAPLVSYLNGNAGFVTEPPAPAVIDHLRLYSLPNTLEYGPVGNSLTGNMVYLYDYYSSYLYPVDTTTGSAAGAPVDVYAACSGFDILSLGVSSDAMIQSNGSQVGGNVIHTLCSNGDGSAWITAWRESGSPANAGDLAGPTSGILNISNAPLNMSADDPLAMTLNAYPVSPNAPEYLLIGKQSGEGNYTLLRFDQASFGLAYQSKVAIPASVIRPDDTVRSVANNPAAGTLLVLVHGQDGHAHVVEMTLSGRLVGRWDLSSILQGWDSPYSPPVISIGAAPQPQFHNQFAGNGDLMGVRFWALVDSGNGPFYDGGADQLVLVTIPR